MAVIVLAIGVVMAIAGGGEIFYGSGYIEIERGWSAFISGTVLLTGGLMTVALGFALRSLADLKSTLLRLGSPIAPSAAVPFAEPSQPEVSLPRREAPVPLRPTEAPLTLDPAGAPGRALQIEPYFDGAARAPTDDAQRLAPLVLAEEAIETAPVVALAEAPRPSADEAFPPPRHPSPPPAAVPAPEASPAMDDWLDRNFADLDRDMAELHERETDVFDGTTHGPLPAEEPHASHAPEAARAADGEATRVDPIAQPSSREPAAAQAETPRAEPAPAVIGRYEADDTSYVMYADGSIEAQSEAGIYRFASMAELKAFIET